MMKASVLDYSYFPNNPLPDIYIEIVTIIVLIALNFYRRGKQPLIQYFDKKYILIWILITLNFFLLASVLTSLEFSNQMKGLISAILFLTSGINIYFAYYLEKTRKIFEENLVISKQVEFQENKLAQNKAYLEKNNRLMHDIKKHYLEIEHALSENQMNYVKEYMKGVYQQYFDREHTSFTGNQVVDSMFFSLQEQCQKEDIQLTCDIHIDKKITLAEKDLAVLLGSLFDRAIKAANQTSQERTIKVTMKTEKHHLILAVEYPKEPVTVLPKGTVEQWEDTQIIHRIVEKYSGMYETTERQGTNGISVLLPLK
ncbi:GHKL domain-containing protein [Enterococcus sp. DIV0187]|uniref:GHKL domain-containing protein n=1 Tax=Enterococcus sp. DIV0187 TaxID=2774644 RepID=UPI003F688215